MVIIDYKWLSLGWPTSSAPHARHLNVCMIVMEIHIKIEQKNTSRHSEPK
ncbi:hypothetical protein DSUL_40124 [Desulfovibrionales bacterium]